MSTDEDIDAKVPEPAPDPQNLGKAPGLPPGQMSLLGPAESQESPPPKKRKLTKSERNRLVTEQLIDTYHSLTGRKAKALPRRIGMIGARLDEGFDPTDLRVALLGWWHCEFYRRENVGDFDWPFTSGEKVEKCQRRFIDEAPIEEVERFHRQTGRPIPGREAEIAKAKREREKQDQEDELLAAIWAAKRQFDARREQAIFDKAYGRLMDDIRTARLYERQKPRQRSDEDIEYMWREIRERAEVIGVLDELREKGLLPQDKGKEESNE